MHCIVLGFRVKEMSVNFIENVKFPFFNRLFFVQCTIIDITIKLL